MNNKETKPQQPIKTTERPKPKPDHKRNQELVNNKSR